MSASLLQPHLTLLLSGGMRRHGQQLMNDAPCNCTIDAIVHLDLAIAAISSMELIPGDADFEECETHVRQLHVAVRGTAAEPAQSAWPRSEPDLAPRRR